MENEANLNIDTTAYSDDTSLYGKKINSIPVPKKNIGIDTDNIFIDNLVDSSLSSRLDLAKLESFTQISSNRETIMELLDTMSEDSFIASALEIYAEDSTEPNDQGDIIWCVSDDPNIAKYITYLLNSMNINKNIYKWVYSLCKYGDVYLRLYRNSEYQDDDLFKDKKSLNEDIIVKAYSKNDHYSHYIEMVPNPAEMFELTRFGKSYAYIKANITSRYKTSDMVNAGTYRYSFKRNDVELYDATNFVHASLEDNVSRIPEEVEIFLNDESFKEGKGSVYTVRRGQSLLYNVFKIWRELTLLENSLMLNRLTKSSIVRIIGVQVGDMEKERVGAHLSNLKRLIEQKSALDVGISLAEYTDPGPVENNIYVPIRGDQGTITMSQVGGDVDVNVKGIADIDYFKNKLYSSIRIPKQYLGDTDDAAGFNGGTSLSLISSRYAKAVKRIQSTIIQAITDAINLMLLDKGLDSYVNKFEIKMQNPMTQEERDRTESEGNKINIIQDVMNLIDGIDITNQSSKLQILKSLLSSTISDYEVMKILEDEIDKLQELENQETSEQVDYADDNDADMDMDFNFNSGGSSSDSNFNPLDTFELQNAEQEQSEESANLPSPEDLGIGDLTDLNNEEV